MGDLIKNTEEKSVWELILGMEFEEKEMIGYGDFYDAFVDEWKLAKEEAKAKLKKYSEEHKDSFDSIEEIFQKVDDTNIGILSTQKFNDVLKSLKLNLISRETLLFFSFFALISTIGLLS